MLEEAIAHYHELLDAETAEASQICLTDGLRERNLFFGNRPLATVLRPRFVTAEQYDLLRSACGLAATAMRRLAAAMLIDPSIQADLQLTAGEQALIAMDPGYEEPSAHSRMDTFLTLDGSSLRFVEYNAESPAAIAYEDELADIFLHLPVMQRFGERYVAAKLPARHQLLQTLLDAWQAFGNTRAPLIAIVDWKGLPTHSEFLLFQQYFHERGLEAIICSPDELEWSAGQLYARLADRRVPVDLVYKRVLTSEFLTHYGDHALEHPLVQAYASGKTCVVNSFRAKLLHKKSIFALLTDDRFQHLFTPEQQAAITKHVPWTRLVRPGSTTYEGATIDLLSWVSANQERLLLKPNDEYGGKGILIGWETDAATWAQGLKDALHSPSVVQERVEIAYEEYPSVIDGQLQIGRRLVDSDPFLFGSEVTGCLTRLSTVTLLNVTAGGGSSIPMFVLRKREAEVK
ncbi:MAG: circularly permuted type 2 ATP-grasp protein [Herpetosiphonaceae bacterium]|nr:circularly permuted type 2 ATP-grasp protein [Herpetosiphonaceae bacterium]